MLEVNPLLNRNAYSPINTIKNAAKSYTNFVFGVEQSNSFANSLQNTVYGIKDPVTKKRSGGEGFKNIFSNIKKAWADSKAEIGDKSLGTVLKESLLDVPKEMKEIKGSSLFGKFSKGLGVLGKRMPLLGNILLSATAIPNIYHAFTDNANGGGVTSGVKEIGKTAVGLGSFAAGSAIGQALIPIPFVGAIIGGGIASLLTSKITGDDFDAKKEKLAEQNGSQNADLENMQQMQQLKQMQPELNRTQVNKKTKNDYMNKQLLMPQYGMNMAQMTPMASMPQMTPMASMPQMTPMGSFTPMAPANFYGNTQAMQNPYGGLMQFPTANQRMLGIG